MAELDIIVNSLNDSYDGNAWHGPSITEVLNKIPSEKVNHKVGNGHSIIEIVLHMIAWRSFVIHKLQGDVAFDISDENNFPKGSDWKKALDELSENQNLLISAVASFDEQKLNDLVPNRKYSYSKLLHGITHHDLYHLGQIVMITRQFHN